MTTSKYSATASMQHANLACLFNS